MSQTLNDRFIELFTRFHKRDPSPFSFPLLKPVYLWSPVSRTQCDHWNEERETQQWRFQMKIR